MVKVLVSARVLDRQVGGNTRYARSLYAGLAAQGVAHEMMRPPYVPGRGRSAVYAAYEGFALPAQRGSAGEVVHFPADTGAVIGGRRPIVSTIHGLATFHVPNVRSGAADRLWRLRVARLAAVSHRIVTVSESSARDIVALAPDAACKLVVIPHGIDHDMFNANVGPADAVERARLGIAGPYFLYLGNLDPRKNVISLCRAAEKVFAACGIPLLIAGAPAWDSAEILWYARNTTGVRYLGQVPEKALVPLIRGAIAFCFPSSYEGFGFPVVEAMACGTPVMCSDRGSLAEVAADAALITGISSAEIAENMIRLSGDQSLRAELRERGLTNAQRFHWKRSIEDHLQVFEDAAR